MSEKKRINLALQGGGAHGAFTWGVLESILDDGRLEIEGICATSAGTMNAVCFAYGLSAGGPEGAKETLRAFWRKVSDAGEAYSPVRRLPWERWPAPAGLRYSLNYLLFDAATRVFSPYQLNPFDLNPLRSILADTVDFEVLQRCQEVKLFISTTRVDTGRVDVFHTHQISLDVAMASAALPMLYRAVEIEGEAHWDGGYIGNPALFPLHYHTESRDVLIVHLNPLERKGVPATGAEIMNRVNEISFNASLLHELRAVAFVQKLFKEDWLKDEYKDRLKHVLVHSLRADEVMQALSVASKVDTDWGFLNHLYKQGYKTMDAWLETHFDMIGEHSTVDLQEDFLKS